MRKALIGLVMAATILTPVAAQAQRGERANRGGERSSEQRVERIQQRNEARQQRAEPRQQQQQAQPQAQAQPQPAPQPRTQYAQRNRGGDNRGNRGGNDRNRGGRGDDGNRGDRGTRQPSIYPQAWQGNPNDPRLRNYQRLERQNQQRGERRDDRRDDRRDWRNDRRDNDRGGWRDNDRRGDRWNRSWRNDRRYDWRGWRNSNRNIFRGSRYYSPYRNHGYSRFSIGFFLQPLFYSNRYWIGDPWQYRLPAAYPGTQWVRYYNDVLLVDVYSGEVIDVIHDFFW